MKNSNENSTRFYSDKHEKSVCEALGGTQQTNSGAGLFNKGDVVVQDASLLIECKTTMSEKNSVSIRKDWINKNEEEAFRVRLSNHCICVNFGPGTSNYYVIDEKLMKILVDTLKGY